MTRLINLVELFDARMKMAALIGIRLLQKNTATRISQHCAAQKLSLDSRDCRKRREL